MNFTKLQGAGNDFILVEASNISRDWSKIARAVCDRHFGVGGDGLLLLLPSEVAHFRMRIFNPDGTEPEACGNGLRCLIRYILDRQLINLRVQEVLVETASGIRKARLHETGTGLSAIQVGMGTPEFGAKDIPVKVKARQGTLVNIKPMLRYTVAVAGKELELDLVSMGNPHAVYFSQEPVADFPLSQIAPEVQGLPVFPRGMNFEVARVLGRKLLEARVRERGAGETLACGSGACAIAVAARLRGYIDNKVDIKLPGGILNVEWGGVGEVLLGGPAETVFTGEWKDETIKTD